jgi:hypothetical protein
MAHGHAMVMDACITSVKWICLAGLYSVYVSDEYRTDFSAVKYFSKIYFGRCGSEKVRVYKLFIRVIIGYIALYIYRLIYMLKADFHCCVFHIRTYTHVKL